MVEYLEKSEDKIIEVKSSSRLSSDEYLTISSNLKKALMSWSEVNIIHDISGLKSIELSVLLSEIKFLFKNRGSLRSKVNKYALLSDNLFKAKALKFCLSPFVSEIYLFKSNEKLKAQAWIKL